MDEPGVCIEFYLLLRAGNPDIASHILSNFYNETRSEYYRTDSPRRTESETLVTSLPMRSKAIATACVETLQTIQKIQFRIAWRTLVHDRFATQRYRKRRVFKRRSRV